MKATILFAGLALVLTGCVTDNPSQANRTIEHNENQALQQDRLARLSDQVQVLQGQMDNLQRELASVKSRLEQASAGTNGATTAELQRLKEKLAQTEAASQQQKQIILDEVAKQLDTITKRGGSRTTTRTSTTPSPSGGTEEGYEHVIKAGETISAIAKAYGVSSDAIMKGNNIKDASKLQVGQKLFIPKK